MSEQSDTTRKPDSAPNPVHPKKNASNNDFGDALRSVYEQTIGEDVPAEMLDLLNKLD